MTDDSRTRPGRRGRLIWNALWSEFTAQSPARMARNEGATDCPFCADLTSGVAPTGARAWIRPNDFPALEPPDGECYILVYSRDHDRRFSQFGPDEALDVVRLWQQMYQRLSPVYPCVMTWETSGAEIGQTQPHPHGQTYGVSIIPELVQREMDAIRREEAKGRPCPFCRTVAVEAAGPRLVYDGDEWLGFTPSWARYPYQVQFAPRRHISDVSGFDGDSACARELATALPRLVRVWDQVYEGQMPYMLALHQLADPRFHLHIELLPVGRAPGKLKLAASSEMGWGFWLNDSLPEEKAAEMRRLLTER